MVGVGLVFAWYRDGVISRDDEVALVFDAERLSALEKVAAQKGMSGDVVAILRGIKPQDLLFEIGAMPLASAPTAFSFESPADPASGRFARGLIDAMLDIPAESGARK